MGKLLGYARVSTKEQDISLQLDALKQAGCERIFKDTVSGARTARKGLEECLLELSKGDVLTVWRLDRLGRSMPHLVSLVDELRGKGIGFRSLQDGVIDTTTANGELIFSIFASLSQFERRLIQERTRAGLESARARGMLGGRKPLSPEDPKVRAAKRMHEDKSLSISEICSTLGVSKATLFRYVNMEGESSPVTS